jgi:hypothetical protein
MRSVKNKWLRRALLLAIDYEESVIDAHVQRVYIGGGSKYTYEVPEDHKDTVNSCEENIKMFRKLLGQPAPE